MLFINSLPTKTVVQIDHETLFERLRTELKPGELAKANMTYSQRVGLNTWIRKNHPQFVLVTKQMTMEFKQMHSEPLPYLIGLKPRVYKDLGY